MTDAMQRWSSLEKTLTRLQLEVVCRCAKWKKEPYDASREGLCGPTIITRWGPRNVRAWVALYNEAHPDPDEVKVQVVEDLHRLVPPALDIIRDTVTPGGDSHPALKVRTAQWVLTKAIDLCDVRTAKEGKRDGGVADEGELELAKVLTLVKD
jgi:hypothetical protein